MAKWIKIRAWADNNPIKIIVGMSILLRLLLIILYRNITIYPDSADYIHLAERLVFFDLGGYEGECTPGYPLLISLSGLSLPVTIFLQNITGIITTVFLYKILLLINFRVRHALLLTMGVICYLPIIFFEFCILTETLTFFFITLTFYFLFGILYARRTGIISYIALCLTCSYLVLIKPFYIFLPVLLFIILIFHNRKRRVVIYRYLIIILFPIIVLTGWSYINYNNTGYFTPTTFYGFNMAQNCVSFAEKTPDEYKEIGRIYAKYRDARIASGQETSMSIWDAYDELKESTGLSLPDLSAKLSDYSKATIIQNPLSYLKQVAISWADFWKTSLYWQYDKFVVPHANIALKYICYAERGIVQVLKCLFIVLIPYNLIKFWKKKRPNPQFVISVVVLTASLLQAFVTYGTNSRFSFPFEVLIITSVLINIYSWVKKRKRPA